MSKQRTNQFVSDIADRRAGGAPSVPFKLEPLEKRLMLSGDPISASVSDVAMLGDGIERLENWLESFSDAMLGTTSLQGLVGQVGDYIDFGALLNYALTSPIAQVVGQGDDVTADQLALDLEAYLNDDLSDGWDVSGTRDVTIASEEIDGETHDVLTIDLDLDFSKVMDWKLDFGDALENAGFDEYDDAVQDLAGYADDTTDLSVLANVNFDFTLKFELGADASTEGFYIVSDPTADEITIDLSADQSDGAAANTQDVDFGIIVMDTDNDGDISNNQHMMTRVDGTVTFATSLGIDLQDAIDTNDDDLISYTEMGDATDDTNPQIFGVEVTSSHMAAEISMTQVFDVVDIDADGDAALYDGYTTIVFDDHDLTSLTGDLDNFDVVNVGDETTASVHTYGDLQETVLFYPSVIEELFNQISSLADSIVGLLEDISLPFFGDVIDVVADAVQGIEDATATLAQFIENSGLSASNGELAAPVAAMREAIYTALSIIPALPTLSNGTLKMEKIIDSIDDIHVAINDDKTALKVYMNLDYRVATLTADLSLDALLGTENGGIGFTTDGTFNVDFGALFNISFGFASEMDGYTKEHSFFIGNDERYFDEEETLPLIDVYLIAAFDDNFSIDAQLGWIGVTVVDILDTTDASNGFNQIFASDPSLDVIDDDQTTAEFHAYLNLNYDEENGFDVSTQLLGMAEASLTITLRPIEVEGGDWFPDFGAILNADWTYDSTEEAGSRNSYNVSMDHVWMRLGEVFSTVINTLTTVPGTDVNVINMILDPLQPVFDVYSSSIPVLDDLGVNVSIEQILKDANEIANDPRVEALIHLLDLVGFLAEAQPFGDDNIPLYIGSFGITPTDPTELQTVQELENLEDSLNLDQQDFLLSLQGGATSEVGKGFYIPLLENPLETLWDAFMGNDIDLFVFDLSFELLITNQSSMDSSLNTIRDAILGEFGGPVGEVLDAVMNPPVGISAGVDFTFSFDLDFQIGYDTKGIRELMAGGSVDDLLDGFYVGSAESREQNASIEISAYIGLHADVSAIVAGGGASGGLDVDFSLTANDLDGDYRLRFGEMKALFDFNPLYLFTMQGSAGVEFSAYFWVGIKIKIPFIGTIKKVLWSDSWNLGHVNLFHFNISLPDDLVAPDLGVRLSDLDAGSINFDTGLLDQFEGLHDGADDDEILLLYMGEANEGRGPYFSGDEDETFTVEMIAENEDGSFNVRVSGVGFEQEFENIRHIVGFGGEGDDEIDIIGFDEGQAATLFFNGGKGDDIITAAEAGALVVYGGLGNDTVYGSDLGDVIYGDAGDDTIYGGAGDDVIDAGEGSDLVFGEEGDDTITLGNGTIADPDAGGDVSYLNTVYAGAGNDTIYGGNANDEVYGQSGDDIIVGGDGYDRLIGGEGNDRIYGGDGDDYISGDQGEDILLGGAGSDTLLGEAYEVLSADAFTVDGEVDYVQVGDGESDLITGGLGDDNLNGGGGDDVLYGDVAEATISDGSVSYTVRLEDEFFDRLNFGSQSFYDTLSLEDFLSIQSDNLSYGGDDVIAGGEGNDLIVGGAGNDEIYGDDDEGLDSGNDVIFGDNADADIIFTATEAGSVLTIAKVTATDVNGGADIINGGLGNDIIAGGIGSDTITDLNGDNVVFGDNLTAIWDESLSVWTSFLSSDPETATALSVDDIITTGAGDDLISGGIGGDNITTGGGSDVAFGDGLSYSFDGVDEQTFLSVDHTKDGEDTLLSAMAGTAAVLLVGGGRNDTLTATTGKTVSFGDSAKIVRKDGTDSYRLIEVSSVANSNGGDDEITGSSSVDIAFGGEGSDQLILGNGANIAFGDAGHINYDTVANSYEYATDLTGNAGADTIATGTGKDTVFGGGADDIITDVSGDNIIFGDNGRLSFDSYQRLQDIYASAATVEGNDQITTGADNDIIIAGGGDDTINAGAGENTVFGDWGTITADGTMTAINLGTGGKDTITTGIDDDIILAGGGNDDVTASAGNNIIFGDWGTIAADGTLSATTVEQGGNDTLKAGTGNDTVLAGGGDDIVTITGGDNIVFGDWGTITPEGTITSTRLGYGGDDTITTGSGTDVLFAGGGDDTIVAGDGFNTIAGDWATLDALGNVSTINLASGGVDTITGGLNSDIIFGGGNNDTITSAGSDMYDIVFGDNGEVRVSEETSAPIFVEAEASSLDGNDAITLSNQNLAYVFGGDGHDTMTVTNAVSYIFGDRGRLTVHGALETPYFETIDESVGGDDTISVTTGSAVIAGGQGADLITATSVSNVSIFGDFGTYQNDTENLNGLGSVFTSYEALAGGRDQITVDTFSTAFVAGGYGADDIYGYNGGDLLAYGDEATIAYQTDGSLDAKDIETSYAGDDYIEVTDIDFALLSGNDGKDSFVVAETGAVNVALISGDSSIYHRDDTSEFTFKTEGLFGGDDDLIYLGLANSAIVAGGKGDDRLAVETTNIGIVSGDEVSVEVSSDTTMTVDVVETDGDGADQIQVKSGALGIIAGGQGGDDAIYADGSDLYNVILGDTGYVETVAYNVVSVEATVPTLEGESRDYIEARNGNFVIMGGTGADSISADAGQDIIFGDYGLVEATDEVDYFDHIVALQGALGEDDYINAGAGDDVVMGNGGHDYLAGEDGNDILIGDNGEIYRTEDGELSVVSTETSVVGHDEIYAGSGMDMLIGGNGTDHLEGGDDNDIIFGDNGRITSTLESLVLETIDPDQGGADEIFGGAGNDTIFGGSHTGPTNGSAAAYNDNSEVEEYLFGGAGHDTIFGDNGRVTISYEDVDGSRVDTITLTPTDIYYGENDLIYGDLGDDALIGGTGNDQIYGDTPADPVTPTLYVNIVDELGGLDSLYFPEAPSDDGGELPPPMLMLLTVGPIIVLPEVPSYGSSTVSSLIANFYVTAAQDNIGMESVTQTFLAISDGIGIDHADATGNDMILGDVGVIQMRDGVPVFVGATSGEIGGDDYLIGNEGDDVIIAGAGSDYSEGNDGEDAMFADYGLVQYDSLGRKRSLDASIFYNGGRDTMIAGEGRDYVFGQGGEENMVIDWVEDFVVGFNGYVHLDENGKVIDSAGGDSTLTTDQLSTDVEGGRFSAIPAPLPGPSFFEIRDIPEVGDSSPFAFGLEGDDDVINRSGGSTSTQQVANDLDQISPAAGSESTEDGDVLVPEQQQPVTSEEGEAEVREGDGPEGQPVSTQGQAVPVTEGAGAAPEVQPASQSEDGAAEGNDETDPEEAQIIEEEEEELILEETLFWPAWSLAAE